MEFEISLNNLHFYSHHGILEHEKQFGNEFLVDLMVKIPYSETIEKDDLAATVSYADLYDIVAKEMENPRNLLEKVASSIVSGIKARFSQIKGGYIRIEKVRPPIPGMLGSASVRLQF